MTLIFKFFHQIGEFLNHMGLTNICPDCGMPYRAYGGWLAKNIYWSNVSPCRRWLCKWCGHYVDEDGYRQAACVPGKAWWTIEAVETPEEWSQRWTPRDVYRRALEMKEHGEL